MPRRGRAPASRGGQRRRGGGRGRTPGSTRTPGTNRRSAPRAGRSARACPRNRPPHLRRWCPCLDRRFPHPRRQPSHPDRRSSHPRRRAGASRHGVWLYRRMRRQGGRHRPTHERRRGIGGSAPARASPRRRVRATSRRPRRTRGRDRRTAPAPGYRERSRPPRRRSACNGGATTAPASRLGLPADELNVRGPGSSRPERPRRSWVGAGKTGVMCLVHHLGRQHRHPFPRGFKSHGVLRCPPFSTNAPGALVSAGDVQLGREPRDCVVDGHSPRCARSSGRGDDPPALEVAFTFCDRIRFSGRDPVRRPPAPWPARPQPGWKATTRTTRRAPARRFPTHRPVMRPPIGGPVP